MKKLLLVALAIIISLNAVAQSSLKNEQDPFL